MNNFYFSIVVVLLCSSIAHSQTIRYVNQNTPCTSGCDGTSWAKAFDHLQYALDVAQSGNQIWVAAGTYKPTKLPIGASSIKGDVLTVRNHTFHLVNGVSVYGGFDGTETIFHSRDIELNETILSGDIGVPNVIHDNIFHVVMSINDSSNTRLDGFSIKYGNSSGGDLLSFAEGETIRLPAGSGFHIHNSSLRVANCKFIENLGNDDGVLFISFSSNPSFTGIEFNGNSGRCISTYDNNNVSLIRVNFIDNNATALYNLLSTTSLDYSEIRGNTTGTLILSNTDISISNSLITGNATSNQAIIKPFCSTCNYTIQNSTITKNDCSSVIENWGDMEFVNNIVWDNTNNDIVNESGASTSISHCILDDGTQDGNISYSSGTTNGGNNLDLDPQFETPVPQIPSISGDLHLQLGSPAINVGDNNFALLTDLDGNTRIFNGTIDIGCYEYLPCVDLTDNILYVDRTASGNNDGSSWSDAFITLGDALSVANECIAIDTVYIAEGVYYPDENITGDSNDPAARFALLRDMVIIGGFPTGGGSPTLRNPILNPTILSGDITQDDNTLNDITLRASDIVGSNSNNILYAANFAMSSYVLDGLIFTGGQALSGVLNGGALYLSGHPIFLTSFNAQIRNCMFYGNQAANNGGAIHINNGDVNVINCVLFGNSAINRGGAIHTSQNLPTGYTQTLYNCSLNNNEANDGRAIYAARMFAENSIFWNGGNELGSSGMYFTNYCNAQGILLPGTGNISAFPLFEDLANGNLRLADGSLSINAGNNGAGIILPYDIERNDRILNDVVDMGCFENEFTCSHPDLAALDSIYTNTDGPNWINNTNWLQNCDPCSWFGITCDGNDRVIDISLTANGLVGELPVDIANLTELSTLRIRSNVGLIGEIPTEIGELTNLAILDLSVNNLTGPIPGEIGNLTNLFFLWIHFNELTGSIPIELGLLPNIGTFRIDGNLLSGCYEHSLLNAVLDPCRFTNASISNGNMFDADWEDFCATGNGSCDCPHPDYAALDSLYSKTNGNNWTTNTNWFQNCDPCTWHGITCDGNDRVLDIDLQVNNLTGELPTEITQLSELRNLQLGVNDLSGPIPNGLGGLQNLQNLWLQNNNFSGSIPSDIGNSQSLQRVYVNSNLNLNGFIPASFGDISSLLVLRTYGTGISGCYYSNLDNLCDQLGMFSTNANISDNTTLSTDWEDFCLCNAGICACNETNHWQGGNSIWDNPANWSLGHVPLACEIVIIDKAGDVVAMPTNYASTIYLIDVGLNSELEIPTSSTLHVLADPGFSNWTSCN